VHDLKEIVKEVSLIIQSEANLHGISFLTLIENTSIPVLCSKDHIKQVILNISKNAFEAMQKNYTLTIEVSTHGNNARLRITDTESGMSEETKQKIFDPFFTSKAKGTGLGLVVCKQIIDMYNGKITITSSKGTGTTVDIFVPLAHK
jgi:two-component system, sporulation sensor kinase D